MCCATGIHNVLRGSKAVHDSHLGFRIVQLRLQGRGTVLQDQPDLTGSGDPAQVGHQVRVTTAMGLHVFHLLADDLQISRTTEREKRGETERERFIDRLRLAKNHRHTCTNLNDS
jgi:hypothetical protein